MNNKIAYASKTKILIVDDDFTTALSIKKALEKLGFEVVGTASNAEEAINSVIADKPNLVFMDIDLGEKTDGIEASEKIKELVDIPIIFLTAFSGTATVDRAKLVGPYGYLVKPFENQELYAAVEMALYKHSMEKKLRENEEKYRSIFDNIQDTYFETSFDSTILEVSPSIKIISKGQYNREDLIGKSMLGFYDDTEDHNAVTEAIQKTGSITDFEVRLKNRDGSLISCSVSAKIKFDDKGNPEKIVGSVHDITDRKQAEEARDQERILLRTIIDNFPNSIFVKDKKYRKIVVNPRHTCRLTEYLGPVNPFSDTDLLGKTDFEIYPKELADKFFIEDQKVLEGGQSVLDKELLSIDANGRTHWELMSKIPLRDRNGAIIGFVGISNNITERKIAEVALQESEAMLNEAMKIAKLSTWEYDVVRNQFTFNDEFYKLIHMTVEREGDYTMSSENYIHKLVYPNDRAMVNTEIQKAIETNDPDYYSQLDHRIICADGEIKYITVHIRIEKNANGRTIKTHGVNQDITERKQAEEEIRESEERFRMLFENVFDGIALYVEDPDPSKRKLVECNERYAAMAGRSREELLKLGNTLELQITLEDKANNGRLESLEKQTAYHGSFSWIRPDGKENIIEYVGMPITWRGKSYSIGIDRDITERRRAEEEITMLAHSLRSVNECVSITDIENNILFVNRSFLNTYGYSEDELIGKHISVVFPPHNPPDLAGKILPATISGGWQGELWNKRKNGSEFQIYLSTTIIKDKDGKPLGLIGVTTDITERKRAEKEMLEQMNEISRFNKLMVGREGRMVELKKEINVLYEKLGEPKKYNVSEG